ncbi:MAG: hypothetical protein KDD00_15185 [Ignavibacteriae bacterium]|nr:hypothetical protein [Ignavibacteriota bacterium]
MKMLQKIVMPLFLLMIIITASGINKVSAQDKPDYSGTWSITFYNPEGKVVGLRTLEVSGDGLISDKANMYLGEIVYLTDIEADLSDNGIVRDGTLTDHDKIEVTGTLRGSFTVSEGNGEWTDYHGSSGTWKAVRSDKKAKN